MATSGKKGKKKIKAIPLQNFLANGNTTQSGITQVAKKVRSRFDDSDEEEGSATLPQVYQLPTAPRANRIYEDDESIPHKPPFLAYITNLPFDIKDEDMYEFFVGYKIESVRLPREDGEYGRLRGFGYIQFETREDLINAISLPDPQIKSRRVRINVSNENDQHQREKRSSNRSRYEGFGSGGSSENKDSTNWRRSAGDKDDERRTGYSYSGRGGDRDRNRDRPARDNSAEAGSWRKGDRPNFDKSPAKCGGGFGSDRFSARKGNSENTSTERERPKLKLEPRTLPLPEIVTQSTAPPSQEKNDDIKSQMSEERIATPEPLPAPKPAGVSAKKVFGSAKPVDTAAREKEVEERLEREKLEKLIIKEDENLHKEKEAGGIEKSSSEKYTEKDKKNTKNATSWRKRDEDVKRGFEPRKCSPDRRGGQPPSRRDNDRRGVVGEREQGGGNRDNRDRRDRDQNYNRGGYDRDNRNIDNRERNDRENYNRGGGRDRGGFSNNKDKNNVRGSIDYRADNRENKERHRDEKSKERDRDNRFEKLVPKYQSPQGGPILSTSNKYALFQDEDDGSD